MTSFFKITYDKNLRTHKLYVTLQLQDNFVIISINFYGVLVFMFLINIHLIFAVVPFRYVTIIFLRGRGLNPKLKSDCIS